MLAKQKENESLKIYELFHFPLKQPKWDLCNNQLRPSFVKVKKELKEIENPYYLIHPFYGLFQSNNLKPKQEVNDVINANSIGHFQRGPMKTTQHYDEINGDWVDNIKWEIVDGPVPQRYEDDIKNWNDYFECINWENGIFWDDAREDQNKATKEKEWNFLCSLRNEWDFDNLSLKEAKETEQNRQIHIHQCLLEGGNYLFEYTIDDPLFPIHWNCWMEEHEMLGLCLCGEEAKIIAKQQKIMKTDFVLMKEKGEWKIEEIDHLYTCGQILFTNFIDIPPLYSGGYFHFMKERDSIQKRVLGLCNTSYGGVDGKRICEELSKTKEKWRNESYKMEEEILDLPWNRCWIDGNLVEGKKQEGVIIVEKEHGKIGYDVHWTFNKRKKEKWMKLKQIKKELAEFNGEEWMLGLKHDAALHCLKRIKKRKRWNERQIPLTEEEMKQIKGIIDKQRKVDWSYESIQIKKEIMDDGCKRIKFEAEEKKRKKKKCVRECIKFIVEKSKGLLGQGEERELEKVLKKVKRRTIRGFESDIEKVILNENHGEWIEVIKGLIELYKEE